MAALALLVVGGMALVNAISGDSEQKGPVSSAPSSSQDGGGGGGGSGGDADANARSTSGTTPAASVPLVIRVTGQPTNVVVRVADAQGKVLTNGVLDNGDILQYDEAPLQVVATNGGALQVTIYGEVQPRKPDGRRGQWFVRAPSS